MTYGRMIPVSAPEVARVRAAALASRRGMSDVVELLVARAEEGDYRRLPPVRGADPTTARIYVNHTTATRLRLLSARSGTSAGSILRHLIGRLEMPDGPNLAIPDAQTYVRLATTSSRHPADKASRQRARLDRARARTAQIVRSPRAKLGEEASERLAELATRTGRSYREVIRALLLQARVDGQDIVLGEGTAIVRIRREGHDPG